MGVVCESPEVAPLNTQGVFAGEVCKECFPCLATFPMLCSMQHLRAFCNVAGLILESHNLKLAFYLDCMALAHLLSH